AHVHARNASLETTKANIAVASEEHELAAGEFANAAKATTDREALRILSLLENQHRTLSRIIKSPGPHAASTSGTPDHHGTHGLEAQTPPTSTASASKETALVQSSQQPISTSTSRRNPHRELSSSIATNLATARGRPPTQRRGLPASPEVTRDNAGGKMVPTPERRVSPDLRHRRQRQQSSTDEHGSASSHEKASDAASAGQPVPDEPFNRFYNTFENLLNRLSAPLAFAGLPLTPTIAGQTAQEAPDKSKPTPLNRTRTQPPTSDPHPDITTLFSRAALRALKDDNPALNPAESFYVVPPSGGTLTYASMLAREREREREHRDVDRAIPSTISEGSDEFVDASENPAQESPRATRRRPLSRESSGLGGRTGKTREELELENEALRTLMDQLSRRLHMWEAQSQSQSWALTQSLRLQREQAKGKGEGAEKEGKVERRKEGVERDAEPEPEPDEEANRRVRELEEELKREREQAAEMERAKEKLGRENRKLLEVVGRYRERWEVLKAGARGRR
ncbi:hypothetical protein P152DRAFT_372737, partial [Eremomyces bilateralis CBS 781.70]